MTDPGEAKYAIWKKSRKVKAAQNRKKPRGELSLSERQDVDAFIREHAKGVPVRNMRGDVTGYRRKKK